MKKAICVLLAVLMLCAVLSACKDSSSETKTRRDTNEIVVGIAQDLDESLDPHTAVAAGTKEVMFNVFEGLMKPTPEGDLTPAVAEDYSISSDKLTYTFTLRDGIRFHNGEEVKAEDVIYSLLRCRDEGYVPAFSVIQSVEKASDREIVITLSEPLNEFLSNLTAAIIPENYADQATKPVGTGPFKYVSREAQESIVLEKFDGYWGTPAYVDRVTYKIVENADSIVMSLQSGAIDIFAHLTSAQTSQLGDGFNIEEGTMNLVQALYLNNAIEPFSDVRVRQALSYAIDKNEIIDMAFDGYGSPIGSSMYPAFTKYFMPELTDYYKKDTAKAKQLLADAGYPDGFSMTITVPSNYQPHIDTATVIVEQLKEIGVTASIELVEWESWLSDVYVGRNFQSTVVGFDASTMTARALLERWTSDHGKNMINYNSAEYDELFKKAVTTYDDAEQTELYKAMERNLTENAANVYIQDLADLVAVNKELTGIRFYPIYVLDLSTVRYS